MITPKGGCAERLGSWKRRAEGECWQQQSADTYSSGGSLLLAVLLLFVTSSRIHNNNARLYWSRWGNSLFAERWPQKRQSSGSAAVQRSTLELTVIHIQIHEDYDARNHLHFVLVLLELQRLRIKNKSTAAVGATKREFCKQVANSSPSTNYLLQLQEEGRKKAWWSVWCYSCDCCMHHLYLLKPHGNWCWIFLFCSWSLFVF